MIERTESEKVRPEQSGIVKGKPVLPLRVYLIYDQRLLQTLLILLLQSLISRWKSAEHRLMQPNWFELPERTGARLASYSILTY